MDLRDVFLTLAHSLLTLPKLNVEWTYDGSEPVKMSMADYLIRSFAESLVVKGTPIKTVIKVLDDIWDEPMLHPRGEPYQLVFR